MGKGRIFGSVAAFALIFVAATWYGCGSSNDQGISFRALGFFTDTDMTTGDAGRCASLQDTTIIPEPGPDNGLFLGLENNMVIGINVNRVDLSYHINGSTLAIPNDVFALSFRLGPSSGQETTPSKAATQVVVVSPSILKFLNDNSSRLPDPPFSMIVFATAVGTTDAGDEFHANRVSYEVLFTPQSGGCAIATPTPGASTAGGGGAASPTP
jgi:hypothetical protein